MSGVLVLLVAAVITLGLLFAMYSRSESDDVEDVHYFQQHLTSMSYRHDNRGGGGGGEWWARTSRLTEDQCRACEAALGSIEWRKPWWDIHSSKTKARWDWANVVLPGVEEENAEEEEAKATPRHPRGMCGFHKMTPREAREVLRGKNILFVGNSVSRRLMYAVADLMAGKRARVNALATDVK